MAMTPVLTLLQFFTYEIKINCSQARLQISFWNKSCLSPASEKGFNAFLNSVE